MHQINGSARAPCFREKQLNMVIANAVHSKPFKTCVQPYRCENGSGCNVFTGLSSPGLFSRKNPR